MRFASHASIILKIIALRLFQACFVAVAVAMLCFFAVQAFGDDIAFRIAGGRYGYDLMDTEAAKAVYHELGLDRSQWVRMVEWLKQAFTLNLGKSLVSGVPVVKELSHTLGHSLMLALISLLIATILAPLLGVWAAINPGSWLDRLLMASAIGIKSLPQFVLGILFMIIFARHLDLLPAAGHGSWKHTVLPALTLGLGLTAVAMQVVREEMRKIMHTPYYQFARHKGLSSASVLKRHGLRNLLVPFLAFLGVQLVTLIEGVVVVETLFAWPGIGHALVHAVFSRDIPIVQGAALFMGLLYVGFNAFVDIAIYFLDPRTRQQHEVSA